ncbi:alpha/beta hydrolase [Aromatoleum evansii]|uniref:alpha/beta hydrolase n=1 Tax=Aromatoleum evansii TaxID=59406 RepID=UPI00145C7D23|nr:alpha/beta hydrolase [Aromatoleum evansii]NMG28072.1 alpha/beta hydrolase [Aromatoleum evansii]
MSADESRTSASGKPCSTTSTEHIVNRRHMLEVALAFAIAGVLPMSRAALAAGKVRRLVLVHGRSQQGKDPAALRAEWMDALRRGAQTLGHALPVGIEVALPFYGDALAAFTEQYDIPLTTDVQTRGAAVDEEFLAFQAEMAESVRQSAGISDELVDAEYGPNLRQKGPLNQEWVLAILRAIDKHGGGMSQSALELFIRDVFLYTTRAGVRDEIDRIVASHLTEAPTVVVGHSLGSVVAYNILRSDRRSLNIPLFITVGSPLGIRAVRDQLRPLRFPPPVQAWYNAFDGRDVVALHALDAANFPVVPAIENNPTVKNHTANRHGVVGYLDDPGVVRHVLGALGV